MTKTFDHVERPRRGPAPNDGAVAAKLLVKTPWNAWLDDDICGALDWPELLALLLRDLPVAPVAPLLSHAMKTAAARVGEWCADTRQREPDLIVKIEDWLATWENSGDPPHAETMVAVIGQLMTNAAPDARYGLHQLLAHDAHPAAPLWFFAHVLQAQWRDPVGADAVGADERWLVDAVRSHRDPVTGIFIALFDQFTAGGACPTAPIPDDMRSEEPGTMPGYRALFDPIGKLDKTMANMTQPDVTLSDVLGPGTDWIASAANLRTLRKHGLAETVSVNLTEEGYAALGRIMDATEPQRQN